MTDARLIVEPSSIRPGHKGPVTGIVWLSMGDVAFPSRGWNDFVVVVLTGCANAALQLLLQIALLRRGKLVIEQHHHRIVLAHRRPDLGVLVCLDVLQQEVEEPAFALQNGQEA